MEELFNVLMNFFNQQSDFLLYTFLFISAMVENLFPPIPGDTITAFGAFLVGTGRLNFFIVYLVTTIGSVVGFMQLFYMGKFLEKAFFIEKNYRFFSKESILDAEKWFKKRGYLVILFNRFLPGVRSVISIVSGISNLSSIKVFFFSLISASIWNFIWIYGGYTLGGNWEKVKGQLSDILYNYNYAVGGLISLFLLIMFLKKLKRRKK